MFTLLLACISCWTNRWGAMIWTTKTIRRRHSNDSRAYMRTWTFFLPSFYDLKINIFTNVLDSLTVPMHNSRGSHLPAVRLCKGTVWKTEEFAPVTRSHNAIGQSYPIFTPTNQKRMTPANRSPCLMPNWQSYCQQARTVYRPINVRCCVCVSVRDSAGST